MGKQKTKGIFLRMQVFKVLTPKMKWGLPPISGSWPHFQCVCWEAGGEGGLLTPTSNSPNISPEFCHLTQVILTLSTQRQLYIPQVKSSVLRDCALPCPQLQTPFARPACHLYFWPTGYKSEVPMSPTSGSIHFLERIPELGETFYLPYHKFMIKGSNSGTARWKTRTGQAWERASVPPPGATLHAPSCVHQPRSSLKPVLCQFLEASLHRRGWLIRRLQAPDSTSSPSPFAKVSGWDWTFQPSNFQQQSASVPRCFKSYSLT